MGMSASQARYLSLTARKSDLEFRGQQINQSRLMLSNQSANLYSSMLSMSVPTPPVETDFMKDVYTFSMGGDTTTLSNYKLSMGQDGYGYDILYSKPATTSQLTASSISGVQKSITRKATQGTGSSYPIKIKTTYDNSSPVAQTPKVSRLVNISGTEYKDRGNKTLADSNASEKLHATTADANKDYASMYNKIHGETVQKATKPSKNNTMSSSSVSKMTKNSNGDITYNYGTGDTRTLHNISAANVCDIFGGSYSDNTFTYTDSLLSNILSGFGVDTAYDTETQTPDTVTVGTNTGNSVAAGGTPGKGNVSFYIDAENMKFYVMKCNDGTTDGMQDGMNVFSNNKIDTNKANMYEYDLAQLLGLSVATDFGVDTNSDQKADDTTVYYNDNGTGSGTTRDYYIFGWDNGFYFKTGTTIDAGGWKINNNELCSIDDPGIFDIDRNSNVNENGADSTKAQKKYQYFRDSSTGDIWELCTTTSTSGSISESWKLFKPNKTATVNDQEAQLLDEKDWPTGIAHTQQNGNYDCYYVPDATGTGGSYYLIDKTSLKYDYESLEVQSSSATQYNANNTYKIEGLTAYVVSNDNIPSTISDAYSSDDYIIYATYNDSDTDLSNPVKYYVFPKDGKSEDAVCSYSYEKSYTGKNELLQGRANILVDENGRLSKIDIANEGTYMLEYGQELDQAAYDEAYREYEYKLQKYEKEMAEIDARTAMIQQQDKKLELQLKSIDTEHSAIQTELEALKKVIDTNIKSSYGTFGG